MSSLLRLAIWLMRCPLLNSHLSPIKYLLKLIPTSSLSVAESSVVVAEGEGSSYSWQKAKAPATK